MNRDRDKDRSHGSEIKAEVLSKRCRYLGQGFSRRVCNGGGGVVDEVHRADSVCEVVEVWAVTRVIFDVDHQEISRSRIRAGGAREVMASDKGLIGPDPALPALTSTIPAFERWASSRSSHKDSSGLLSLSSLQCLINHSAPVTRSLNSLSTHLMDFVPSSQPLQDGEIDLSGHNHGSEETSLSQPLEDGDWQTYSPLKLVPPTHHPCAPPGPHHHTAAHDPNAAIDLRTYGPGYPGGCDAQQKCYSGSACPPHQAGFARGAWACMVTLSRLS
ncbi:hypothetical protein FB451DRAFT_1440720 [Mycena latifolia]|nr:hypothetical protein FB451DRAFT_1440720 [Mycena latifolia]